MKDALSNEPPFGGPKVVRDHAAVDLLMNLKATRLLAPFMRGEHTLGTAAAVLEVPASSLAYWVNRFVRASIIEVTRLQPRAGKAAPVYRAVASEFRVPLDAMPRGARDEFLHGGRQKLFTRFTKSVERAAHAHFQGGLRLTADRDGGVELGFVEPEGESTTPVTEWWATITLTDDDAAELHRTLEGLVERFGHERPAPGRRQYVMVLGLTPRARGT